MIITRTLIHFYHGVIGGTSLHSATGMPLGYPKNMSHNEVARCLETYWPMFKKMIKVEHLTEYNITATFEISIKRD